MIRIILMREHMNAVDDSDNLVGFSTGDDCCANGGWFVSDKIEAQDECINLAMDEDKVYPEYTIDTTFFKGPSDERDEDISDMVVFRFVSWNKCPLYLHLFNCHNGYYGKGFTYNFGGKLVEGSL